MGHIIHHAEFAGNKIWVELSLINILIHLSDFTLYSEFANLLQGVWQG